ncbi:fatty acid desaturase-domain-containing protein [Paraphysoderma sedebokerense]|nr:fatty acid desaturase-domain-containing protein [Paraphysoderma sedebokerense]
MAPARAVTTVVETVNPQFSIPKTVSVNVNTTLHTTKSQIPTGSRLSKRLNLKVWTWEEIKLKIENEKQVMFIFDGGVYNVTKWISYHPGGELALHHLNGKDATDHVRVFHPDFVIQNKLPNFCVGRMDPEQLLQEPPQLMDPALYPSLEVAKNVDNLLSDPTGHHTIDSDSLTKTHDEFTKQSEKVVAAYRRLDAYLHKNGYYSPDYMFYVRELFKLIFLFGGFILTVTSGSTNPWVYLLGSVFCGVFWHQSAFVAHDAGHNSVTCKLERDQWVGWVLGNVTGGISIGWWKKSHYVHHIVTNHASHDPDIQHMPFFAITSVFFENIYSTFHGRIMKHDLFSKYLVSLQHYLYYPVLCVARFNLYAQSFIYLCHPLSKHKKWEATGLFIFWSWYLYVLSFIPTFPIMLVVVFVSHAITFLLHLQITLSHFAMSTVEPPHAHYEPFPTRQLRTTMDVDCPRYMDWFHGGLQFQTIHHLYPRLPRSSLRKAVPLVQKFCDDVGLIYHHVEFIKGNGMVLGVMKEVADQVKIVMAPLKEGKLHDH